MTHLAVPLTLARDGSFATVDDGSADDITQNVRAVLLTEPGSRITDPDYGVSLHFSRDLDGIADAVRTFEPRASTVAVQVAVDQAGQTDITVTTGGDG